MYMYVCMYVCMHVCMYVCMPVCVYIYIHLYMYIYIYKYMVVCYMSNAKRRFIRSLPRLLFPTLDHVKGLFRRNRCEDHSLEALLGLLLAGVTLH